MAPLTKKNKKLPFEKWIDYLGKFRTDKLMQEIRGYSKIFLSLLFVFIL